MDFKEAGDVIVLIGSSKDDINSSEYLHKIHGVEYSPAPYFDLEEEFALQKAVGKLIHDKLINSAHDVSEGGLFVTLIESCFNRCLGFEISTDTSIRKDAYLFGEAQSRVVVSIKEKHLPELKAVLAAMNIPFEKLGTVTGGNITIDSADWGNIRSWKEKYDNAISKLLAGHDGEARTGNALKKEKMSKKIAIIGGGNLGTAIAEGLLKSKFCKASDITVTKRNISTLKNLADKGVTITTDNNAAVRNSELVILAIKPFQVKDVLNALKKDITTKHILVSVVTGVSVSDIDEVVKKKLPLFRAMPNTAIAIQESMTCLSFSNASDAEINLVKDLFDTVGKTTVIDEKLMDAATVLGACGTAYAMRYIRANIQGGIEIGFDAVTATLIASQTVKGAAELLLQKGTHPEQEIDKVTTPKGCTIAGLNEMEHQGFSSSLIKGIATSYNKIVKG